MAKKSIANNYIYNLIYQILLIILPIATVPYLSRVLGAENIGISGYTTSIVAYFILFGTLGIASYAQREIAYVQDDKKAKSKIFYEIVIFRLITMAISLVTFYFTFATQGEYELYYKILIIQLLTQCIDIGWFFQGQEEFKKTVVRNVFVKIIGILAIFMFVKTPEDLWLYMLILVLSEFLGNLSLWLYLPKYLQKIKIKELQIFKHIKPTISFFIPQIAIQVYTILDKTMIGVITGNMSEVGIYEYSQRIVKMTLTVVTALGIVVAPRIANIFMNGKKEEISQYLKNSINFVWFLGIPLMLGLMAISNCFVLWFFGEEFATMGNVIICGAPIILAIGLNNVTGVQYLMQVQKQNIFTVTVVIGAILNFILNMFLIRMYGALGAIISSVIAEVIIFIAQLIYMKNKIDISGWFKVSLKYWFSGIIMFIVLLLINERFVSSFYNTFLQVGVGVFIYFGILLLMKDEFLLRIISTLKDKVKNKN